jgi:hypothetical protein
MKRHLLFGALCTCFISFASASAATTDFTFTFAGSGISGSGTLTASTTSTAGEYLISGISGTADGSEITSLFGLGDYPTSDPPANDNELFYPSTSSVYLDDAGFSFANAAGTDFNLFYGLNEDFDTSTAYQFNSGTGGAATTGGALTSFTLTPSATAPEPSSFLLLGTGLLGTLGVMRKRFA